MSQDLAARWANLLQWLEVAHDWQPTTDCKVEWKEVPGAGRGLFVTEDVERDTIILRIPSSALLNPASLLKTSDDLAQRSFVHHARAKQTKNGTKRQKLNGNSSTGTVDSRLLTSTQVLAMYLARNRPKPSNSASEPGIDGENQVGYWSRYLQTLPMDFRRWHPLTWMVRPPSISEVDVSPDPSWSEHNDLASHYFPLGSRKRLARVFARYQRDKLVFQSGLQDDCLPQVRNNMPDVAEPFPSFHEVVSEEDFLWGWLNVNTRTLYMDFQVPTNTKQTFGQSHLSEAQIIQEELHGEENNHTMAPILDFANHCHTTDERMCHAETFEDELGGDSQCPDSNTYFRLKAPATRGLKKGDEVLFAYGMHPDDVLLADYGFVSSGHGTMNPWNEVQLDEVVERLSWTALDGKEADLKKRVLETHDYLGDYTLHAGPDGPQVGHRLIPCLRLIHLNIPLKSLEEHISDPTKVTDPILRSWLATIWGEAERTCDANEEKVRRSLVRICEAVVEEAEDRLDEISALVGKGKFTRDEAVDSIMQLWKSNAEIAKDVLAGIKNGDAF